jgi:hypothetical protein
MSRTVSVKSVEASVVHVMCSVVAADEVELHEVSSRPGTIEFTPTPAMYAPNTGRQRDALLGIRGPEDVRATPRCGGRASAKWKPSAIASAVHPTPASSSKKTLTA